MTMNLDHLSSAIESYLNAIGDKIKEDHGNFGEYIDHLVDGLSIAERIASIQNKQQSGEINELVKQFAAKGVTLPTSPAPETKLQQPEPLEPPQATFKFPGNVRIPEGRSITPKPAIAINREPSESTPTDVWADPDDDRIAYLNSNAQYQVPTRQDYQQPYPVPNGNSLSKDKRNQAQIPVQPEVQYVEQQVQQPQYVELQPMPQEMTMMPVERMPQQSNVYQPTEVINSQFVEQPMVMGRVVIRRGNSSLSPMEQMMSDIIAAAGIPPVMSPNSYY